MRLDATLHNDFFDGHMGEVSCRDTATMYVVLNEGNEPG